MDSQVNSNKAKTMATEDDYLSKFRISSFEALGFSADQAAQLAAASMTVEVKTKSGVRLYERPLSWHKVRPMLEGGCPPELALKILL